MISRERKEAVVESIELLADPDLMRALRVERDGKVMLSPAFRPCRLKLGSGNSCGGTSA